MRAPTLSSDRYKVPGAMRQVKANAEMVTAKLRGKKLSRAQVKLRRERAIRKNLIQYARAKCKPQARSPQELQS